MNACFGAKNQFVAAKKKRNIAKGCQFLPNFGGLVLGRVRERALS